MANRPKKIVLERDGCAFRVRGEGTLIQSMLELMREAGLATVDEQRVVKVTVERVPLEYVCTKCGHEQFANSTFNAENRVCNKCHSETIKLAALEKMFGKDWRKVAMFETLT